MSVTAYDNGLRVVVNNNAKTVTIYNGKEGPQGDPGDPNVSWAIQEVPSGTKNGINKSFTLAHTPVGIVEIYWGSGLGCAYMVYNVDYTYSGKALTLTTFAPESTDYFVVRYPYA